MCKGEKSKDIALLVYDILVQCICYKHILNKNKNNLTNIHGSFDHNHVQRVPAWLFVCM